jgi:NAD(P)-dependent dehydrogenase (short-subunit alcohol dehydrogenase family)
MSRVLITGASKGIGRATAHELAVRGHEVVATARDVRTLDDLPVDTRLTLDVTDQASVDRAVAAAGDLDALVSNARLRGAALHRLRAPVESVPLAEVERLFQLNTLGALRVAQAVLPGLRARGGGRVLFVSSVLGRLTIPLSGAYAASTWALEALAETLAVEVGHFGISVTLLQPGAVSSGGIERAPTYLGDDDPYLPLARQLVGARGSFITVEDVAAAVADALEQDSPPLRIPVGAWAEAVLAARAATPETSPFRIAPLEW